MKEELIKLAKELGFKPLLMVGFKMDKPIVYYLWLCELQKWLIKNHRISVEVDFEPNTEPVGVWECDVLEMDKPYYHPIQLGLTDYVETLQAGCFEALKLLKTTKRQEDRKVITNIVLPKRITGIPGGKFSGIELVKNNITSRFEKVDAVDGRVTDFVSFSLFLSNINMFLVIEDEKKE